MDMEIQLKQAPHRPQMHHRRHLHTNLYMKQNFRSRDQNLFRLRLFARKH